MLQTKNLKLFYLIEHSTLKPKLEGSNPVTGTGEDKMVKQKQEEKMEI